VRRRFLGRHPKSELYAGFGDFSFWRMAIASAHLNGGFARAADLGPAMSSPIWRAPPIWSPPSPTRSRI